MTARWREAFLSPLEAECLLYAFAGRVKAARQRHAERQDEIKRLEARQATRIIDIAAGEALVAAFESFDINEAAE